MEDFLELEEFLELEDGEKIKDLDSSREASHHIVHEHLRPPICAEEVVGFHKRVKRIYIEERMYMSKASHPVVHEHLRPPICAEEVVGFHKRVKRIYDPVKIVVPCDMFEVEFSIPPDKGVHLSSYV
ncbi:hypothetical protein HID58_046868, partial [Brassica napus]